MTTLSAAQSQIAFILQTATAGVVSKTDTSFTWQTTDGHRLTAIGTNFSYFGNLPVGGTVTRVEFDWIDLDHPVGVVDAVASGFAVPLSSLTNPIDPPTGENAFWQSLLKGNDLITGSPQGGTVIGDFLNIIAPPQQVLSVAAGNDTMSAVIAEQTGIITSRGGPSGLIGDVLTIEGNAFNQIAFEAHLDAGNDTISQTGAGATTLIGDVDSIKHLGSVDGGNDIIQSDAREISLFGGGLLIGDANSTSGFLAGGDDTITGTNFAFTKESIAGDVNSMTGGRTVGGADFISGRAGQEFIAGDVMRMQAGQLIGGSDRIQGGQDSDIIAGDLFAIGRLLIPIRGEGAPLTVNVSGGGDLLFGQQGDDWIVGDVWSGENVAAASSIVGGNDFLGGGDGNDTLYGDVDAAIAASLDTGGNDTFDGGLGDDVIDGQLGFDTATFTGKTLAVAVDLLAGTATGQGNDRIVSIEAVIGTTGNDTLRGSHDNNRLSGSEGNDLLVGRNGADTLAGGAGNDRIFGENGSDSVLGGEGADVFFQSPGASFAGVTDTIGDFQNGTDRVNIAAYNFVGFNAVRALTTATATGIKIDVPGLDVLLVNGLTLAQFSADDVVLV